MIIQCCCAEQTVIARACVAVLGRSGKPHSGGLSYLGRHVYCLPREGLHCKHSLRIFNPPSSLCPSTHSDWIMCVALNEPWVIHMRGRHSNTEPHPELFFCLYIELRLSWNLHHPALPPEDWVMDVHITHSSRTMAVYILNFIGPLWSHDSGLLKTHPWVTVPDYLWCSKLYFSHLSHHRTVWTSEVESTYPWYMVVSSSKYHYQLFVLKV